MKVIIPVVNDKEDKNRLAKSFHNASYACIFNTLNGSCEWYSTMEITEKPGNLSLALKRMGVYTVISSSMPFMALGLFTDIGMTIYKAQGDNLNENIDLFINKRLERFTLQSTLGGSGNCSGSCGSCGTSCN